jgi:hypothetical protein
MAGCYLEKNVAASKASMFRLQTRQAQSGQRLQKDETLADLWRETRFKAIGTIGCRGHLVDVIDSNSNSSTVKGVATNIDVGAH